MLRQTSLILWRIVAVVAFVLGVIALAVPVLPTVPFWILAAWAASKAWPALERWLLAHRLYGSHIRNWRERGSVPRNAKVLATLMMSISAVGLQFATAPLWLQVGAPLTMLIAATWLWMRPES